MSVGVTHLDYPSEPTVVTIFQMSLEHTLLPARGWFSIDWKTTLEYRDLLWLMVRRDFVSKYKQTLLGPIWFVAQPLVTTAIFIVVFSFALQVDTQQIAPVLFYLSGLLVWGYVSNSFSAIARCLTDNAELCKRVFFPRIFLPLVGAISHLVPLGLQFVIYGLLAWAYGQVPVLSPTWLLLPVILLEMVMLSLGLGLIFASLTVRLRDLHHVSTFVLTLWMYASPIAYSLEKVPDAWKPFFILNPITLFVSFFRECFFGKSLVTPELFVTGTVVTLFVFIIGNLFFLKLEQNFIDTI